MKKLLSILIPTYNNTQQLTDCIRSIQNTGILSMGVGEVIIINNGQKNSVDGLRHLDNVQIIDAPDNLGWEGGLKEGLKHTTADFVCFQNDDTFIPTVSQHSFYQTMLRPFINDHVAAVGPSTTTAAGIQSVFANINTARSVEVKWLIFFCVIVRRSALDAVGGIDDTLPGGDDFDLSIRLRKAGHHIVYHPEAFIIHHGFQTGTRVRGNHTVQGGWNSPEMTERTNIALIRKHGFKTYIETMQGQLINNEEKPWPDYEGDFIRAEFDWDNMKVLDLACGFQKTHPKAIGVDRTPTGETVPLFVGQNPGSQADIVADVTKTLPFEDESVDGIVARHIIEHIPDAIGVIRNWIKPLKSGGKIVIATPDDKVVNGIPLSFDHVHSFNQDALRNIGEAAGLKFIKSVDCNNGVSFFQVFEKIPVFSLDREYDGDCTTHAYRPELVRAD